MTPPRAMTTPAIDEPTASPLPDPPAPRKSGLRALAGPIALASTGLAASAYIYFNDPNNGSSIYPKCPLKYLTGLDCPGCGLTRAMYSLVHMHPLQAVSHNLLIILLIPWLAMAVIRWGAHELGYKVPRLFEVRQWMVPTMIVLLVIFSVARNLPIEPFHWFNSSAAGQ